MVLLLIFQAVVQFFCSWPGSDLGSIKRSILCKMRWRGMTWYNVTVIHISTVIGRESKVSYELDADLTLFEWALSVRFKWEFELWSMLTGCWFLRIVIPWRDLFFLEEATISIGSSYIYKDIERIDLPINSENRAITIIYRLYENTAII